MQEKLLLKYSGGKVILRGKVRSFAERDDAEIAAWNAPGVNSVESKLEIEVRNILLKNKSADYGKFDCLISMDVQQFVRLIHDQNCRAMYFTIPNHLLLRLPGLKDNW